VRGRIRSDYRGGAPEPVLTSLSRKLRREATDSENKLWHHLRGGRMLGAKFRRQHEFGRYILDFFCAEAEFAIEIDGSQHLTANAAKRDSARDAFLHAREVDVLRYTDREVLLETNVVLEAISRELGARLPSP
jgi:very-short-patch-repair endonuclease